MLSKREIEGNRALLFQRRLRDATLQTNLILCMVISFPGSHATPRHTRSPAGLIMTISTTFACRAQERNFTHPAFAINHWPSTSKVVPSDHVRVESDCGPHLSPLQPLGTPRTTPFHSPPLSTQPSSPSQKPTSSQDQQQSSIFHHGNQGIQQLLHLR